MVIMPQGTQATGPFGHVPVTGPFSIPQYIHISKKKIFLLQDLYHVSSQNVLVNLTS